MLQVNISHWHARDFSLQQDKTVLGTRVAQALALHEVEMTRIARLKPTLTETEHMNLEKGLRLYMLRAEALK
jgi:hypothetical protein